MSLEEPTLRRSMGSPVRLLSKLDSRCRETSPLESQAEHEKTAEHPPDLTQTALRCFCRRQGLPRLSGRWHSHPSCAPHGARHSDGEAGRLSRRRNEQGYRPGCLYAADARGRAPGTAGLQAGCPETAGDPGDTSPGSSRGRAPAGGRTGTRVRLPSASVPFPRSR